MSDAGVSVAALLTRARHHARARQSHTGRQKDGILTHAPDYAHATAEAAQALTARLEAHALDPHHTDPAWREDQLSNKGVSHEAMVTFLQKYVDTP